ncbi:MAG: amino acid permease [Gemmataceae bacterium]|nr:amino acid permease [Gemmataceae bacterium]
MSTADGAAGAPRKTNALLRPAQVIIVGSVMFTFISYWRTAAVVLCDLASTSYYIGGIVEQAIGPAAPWFILAVMLFSYFVRNVYIESCSLFVRGGVYRVVREALGPFMAKLAVSALMFDYILTGPISSVSAGQYIVGLGLDSLTLLDASLRIDAANRDLVKRWGSVAIACGITLYFYRQNLRGIHESSTRALQIVVVTMIMAVVMFSWCGLTLAIQGAATKHIPWQPDLGKKWEEHGDEARPKVNPILQEQEDPLGFLPHLLPAEWEQSIRHPANWLSFIGFIGIMIAFGHSVLSMSGYETLAQVYREVESPKLPNFKKAALIVFAFSLLLTGVISFMAVLLIPGDIRMKEYSDNLIGGLAMNVIGPLWARLLLNAFVTVVGFLILAGAVNTSIIGSNGVLNRVAEDGVLSDWFLKPHVRFGTTYRLLNLIVGMQLFTIILSQGNVYLLGEAYAFGVVWSFVFQAFSMVVLRFKDPRPREYKFPGNLRVGGVELPIGLALVFIVLLITAVLNLVTKEVATIGGLTFGALFFTIFTVSERYFERQRKGTQHEHLEQFSPATAEEVTSQALGLTRPYRKLVAIRSPQNLYMLEKTLSETDPETTDVVVMTAKSIVANESSAVGDELDRYDQQLMTAVVQRAEKAGKQVHPLIVPTNNPLHAVLKTAKELQAQELIIGASNKYTADEQLEQFAFYWINLHNGQPAPITLRILTRDRDMYLDLAGGNRIPKISERKARSVAELRAAGVGVDRVLLVYDGSPAGSDLFQSVLTMLDPQVQLGLLPLIPPGSEPHNGHHLVKQDQERARNLGRELKLHEVKSEPAAAIVTLAQDEQYDVIVISLPEAISVGKTLSLPDWIAQVVRQAHCRVFLTTPPSIPQEVVDKGTPPA